MSWIPASGEATADILVVDDTPANLLAFEAALGDLARHVVRARSGEEALRVLLDRDFALIILDVQMPGLNGFETAKLIRERKRSRHTPIIFVTAHDHLDRDVRRAYALGAVDFMWKPFAPEVLRAKVAVFVALHERTVEVARQAALLREHEQREHEREIERERDRWQAEFLRRQVQEMAEANRRKDEFLAMLSHELRNPLAPIVTGLDLLRQRLMAVDGLDPKIHRLRERMERQVHQVIRLVDDLLDVARISSGKLELRKERVLLSEVIDQAVVAVQPLVSDRQQELTVSLPERPVALTADGARLTQVVVNLLTNASRYTQPRGAIQLACSARGRTLTIAVRDNGRGISADTLPHVFDMFAQERKASGGGLGLGLALVKRLVELHGGSVEAHSAGLDQGSEFTVHLPIEAEVEAPAPVATSAANANGARDKAAGGKRDGLRVVVVDDNEDIRDTMQQLLMLLGHEVHVAEEGEQGVALILDKQPDVAIIDIGLPMTDGFEVARKVRARLGRDRVRLVAMTGYGQPSDRERSRDAGFDAHLVKPAHAEAIQKVLASERRA